jgi:hypothetical protein
MGEAKRRAAFWVAEIDEAELAVRLMERGCRMKRPVDASPGDILEEAVRAWPVEGGPFPFRDMARIAIEYLRECVNNGVVPS